MKKGVRSQAAMEFLMTYGWAIMVVLIGIGSLSYFGVLSPDKFVPNRCIVEPGISCNDFKVQRDSVTLVLKNSKGEDITINQITAGKCIISNQGLLKNGEKKTYILGSCSNEQASRYKEAINISYTGESGLLHKSIGSIISQIQGGLAYSSSTVQLNPSDDTYVYEFAPTSSFGTSAQIQVYPWEPSWTKRGLIKFEISGIPNNAIIKSAVLYLHESTTFGSTRTIGAYRITSSWDENSVTWNSIGTDFEETNSAAATLVWDGVLGWNTWNLTSDVSDFIDRSKNNFGWILIDTSEDSSQAYWYFKSKESPSDKPYLEIEYDAVI
jgi:hypothetical protein